MIFRFVGEEASEFMGFKWFPGTEHDVTDAHAVNKLSHSVLFEKVEDTAAKSEPKKRGPRPQQPVSDNGDDSQN